MVSINLLNFQINVADQTRTAGKVQYYPRASKKKIIKKTTSGEDFINERFIMFTKENPIIKKVMESVDLTEALKEDVELEDGFAGKRLDQYSKLYFDEGGEICYNFIEYDVPYDIHGKLIPCPDGTIFCDERIKKTTEQNVNTEAPVTWINAFTIDLLKAIQTYVFETSYMLWHTDGIQFDFLYRMAKSLEEQQRMVLMATIIDKKPVPLIMRTAGKPAWAFLEGRIEGEDKYALILHLTRLKVVS